MTETTRRDLFRYAAATVVATGLAGTASATPDAEDGLAALSPDGIRGLKWRGAELAPPPAIKLSARFDTQGLPYATAAYSLANNNLTTVVLRVANKGDLPAGTTLRQRDDEVIKLLRELHRQKIRVYLFKRQWMQRRGIIISNQRPFGEAGADTFIAEMSALINRARREGMGGTLQGVAAIETNLDNCAQVRERALYVARGINARTAGWLRSRTLLMPGAGMGPYFKGIHNGGRSWLTQLQAQTGYFALIYKHMESQGNGECKLERLNDAWRRNVGWSAKTTVDQQIAFLRGTMGLSDLENYFRAHRPAFPRHTHVVFWGDHADGIAGTSQYTDPRFNYNTVRALHRLLVKANHWHGHFFNFPFAREGATGHHLWRYLITVKRDGSNARKKNLSWNRSRTHRVWNEWHMWSNEKAVF